MATIGLISDTHGRLAEAAYRALDGCDAIIHAGDIGSPLILDELATIAPVTAVLGNNDFAEYGISVTHSANVDIAGVRFLVAHYPQDVALRTFGSSALAPGDPLPEVCVHGHTHVPHIDYGPGVRPATLRICPGSASLPRGGWPKSVGFVQVVGGVLQSAKIVSLDGDELLRWG